MDFDITSLTWYLTSGNLLLFVLILLATSGLTLLHLLIAVGVSGYRRLRHGKQPVRVDEPEAPGTTVAFLVAVYNDELTIGPCVESILAQTRKPDQVIVVDDGSTDRTPEVLEGLRARGVTVVRMPQNGGKTRALEQGLQHVTSELVAITDADSIVHADYLKHMVPRFNDAEVAGVGGAVESIPHTWVTAARQVEYLITLKIDRRAEDEMGALLVLPGVSSTYRTRVLREMGFEHDTIAEDFDLTFRMHKAGHKLSMEARALVYTSDPPTLKAYQRQLVRWYTDLWITVGKHRDMWGRKVFGAIEVPWLALNMIVYSVFVLGVPVYLLIVAPERLPVLLVWELLADLALTLIAFAVYRRGDVLWAALSRFPTRFIARWTTLWTLGRVLAGRPGKAWAKLERRGTAAFLASQRTKPTRSG